MEGTMRTIEKLHTIMLAIVAAAAFAFPVIAQDMAKPVTVGDVTYINGGVGMDERKALESTEKNYDLIISNADKKGEFTLDTNVVITGKAGREMLKVDNTGPLFYVKLPAGEYTVKAMNGDLHAERKVNVSPRKQVYIHFIWASGNMPQGMSKEMPMEKGSMPMER
jgi:hypothetical protein